MLDEQTGIYKAKQYGARILVLFSICSKVLKYAVSPLISKVRKTIDKYYVLMNGNSGQGYCRVKSNEETQP